MKQRPPGSSARVGNDEHGRPLLRGDDRPSLQHEVDFMDPVDVVAVLVDGEPWPARVEATANPRSSAATVRPARRNGAHGSMHAPAS